MPNLTVVPFRFEHIATLGDATGEVLLPPTQAVLLENHKSFTGLTDDGEIVGCAGVVKIWTGRWHCWAHVSKTLAASYKLPIVREVRKFLATLGPSRVEAAILVDRQDHLRFAIACGFNTVEATYMDRYLPDGRPAMLLSRIAN